MSKTCRKQADIRNPSLLVVYTVYVGGGACVFFGKSKGLTRAHLEALFQVCRSFLRFSVLQTA